MYSNQSLETTQFRIVLKYIYTGELKLADENGRTSSFCTNLTKIPSAGNGCTPACGGYQKSEDRYDCIFTDFQKFQRLVEFSELTGLSNWIKQFETPISMTGALYGDWYSRWNRESAANVKKNINKIFPDKDTECQYFINMYKLAMRLEIKNSVLSYVDDYADLKMSDIKQHLRELLLDPSRNFTSTGFL